MIGPLGRTAYALGQGARLGLFWGQYLLSARVRRKELEGKSRMEPPLVQ